jgi:hypothetical protein
MVIPAFPEEKHEELKESCFFQGVTLADHCCGGA